MNAAAAPACTTTVLAAEPATPQWNPYTVRISSNRLATLATTTIFSGVRRSL